MCIRDRFDKEGEWFIDDARKADPKTMPEFDLLCGGFPCQAFSIAGARKGFGDTRGTLFFELARLADVYKRQSENAGISSANDVRIIMAESLRFLEEGSSAPS